MKVYYNSIKILMILCIWTNMEAVRAQQPPQYTQYMYNTAVLNSGYTGTSSKLDVNLLHRSQWVGVDGAPNTQSFSILGRLKDKTRLGLTVVNDKIGASHSVDINGLFAYEINTGDKTRLSLGVNAGLDILDIEWSKGTYEDDLDPVFAEDVNTTRPIFGVGAYFYSDKWYMGISTHNFLNSQVYNDNEETVTDRKSQFYFMAGYVLKLSGNLKFKPAILTKHVAGAPITWDVSTNFLIQEKLALGLGYRYDDALSALAGFHVSPSFFLGYAYDYSVAGLKSYSDGSHEIILKYNLFEASKRALSPRFF